MSAIRHLNNDKRQVLLGFMSQHFVNFVCVDHFDWTL